MKLDSLRTSSENHALFILFLTHMVWRGFIHLSLYRQTVASHCLSLTSCEKDALRLLLVLDCHFICENRLPSLLIDAAEHHERCDVSGPEANVPVWHVSISISKPFAQHTCQLNAPLCYGALFHRDIWFSGRGRQHRKRACLVKV